MSVIVQAGVLSYKADSTKPHNAQAQARPPTRHHACYAKHLLVLTNLRHVHKRRLERLVRRSRASAYHSVVFVGTSVRLFNPVLVQHPHEQLLIIFLY